MNATVQRLRRLAGQAADRQAVAAVRGDGDVEHVVAQLQQRRAASATRLEIRLGKHQDAGVVVAEAELARRADHPVGDVAVGLARGDREAAGQHGAGQRDHDDVADREVVRAADDAAGTRAVVVRTDVDLAPADRLAVGVRSRSRTRAPGRSPADR